MKTITINLSDDVYASVLKGDPRLGVVSRVYKAITDSARQNPQVQKDYQNQSKETTEQDLKVTLTIPKEFIGDYNRDRFADCFDRITTDIDYAIKHKQLVLAGNYEREVIDMLQAAFMDSVQIKESVNIMNKPVEEQIKDMQAAGMDAEAVEYKGKYYILRYLPGMTVSVASLGDQVADENGNYTDQAIKHIDSRITYYVPDDKITLPDKELCDFIDEVRYNFMCDIIDEGVLKFEEVDEDFGEDRE